jgi:hypothetical protein
MEATMKFPRLGRLVPALVLAAAAAGCSDMLTDNPNGAPFTQDALGEYELLAVNGRALPALMQDQAAGYVELDRGELRIGAGHFSQTLHFLERIPRESSQSTLRASVAQGAVTIAGSRIRFRPQVGGEFEGTYQNGRIQYSIQANSDVYVFTFGKV